MGFQGKQNNWLMQNQELKGITWHVEVSPFPLLIAKALPWKGETVLPAYPATSLHGY